MVPWCDMHIIISELIPELDFETLARIYPIISPIIMCAFYTLQVQKKNTRTKSSRFLRFRSLIISLNIRQGSRRLTVMFLMILAPSPVRSYIDLTPYLASKTPDNAMKAVTTTPSIATMAACWYSDINYTTLNMLHI